MQFASGGIEHEFYFMRDLVSAKHSGYIQLLAVCLEFAFEHPILSAHGGCSVRDNPSPSIELAIALVISLVVTLCSFTNITKSSCMLHSSSTKWKHKMACVQLHGKKPCQQEQKIFGFLNPSNKMHKLHHSL